MRLSQCVQAGALFLVAAAQPLSVYAAPSGPDNENAVVPAREGVRAPQGYARPPFHIKPSVTSTSPTGLTPQQVRRAYGFDQLANQGAGQTIGIVDAYDHRAIESDLSVFNQTFGLAPCTTLNGCFKKIYVPGPKPRTDPGWALEATLDVEWAHAIAPQAKILLIVAKSSSLTELMKAVDLAVKNGATVVSMSFGANEFKGQSSYDYHFNVSGVTFVAASGDSGNGAEFPASSRYLIAVGGTKLTLDQSGSYIQETAWSGTGGGLSAYAAEPAGQTEWPLPYAGIRGVPDVAYHADPGVGFPVYSSVAYNGQSGWFRVGGTSAGAPQWAGLIAIANSLRVEAAKPRLTATYDTLYRAGKVAYGTFYNDVTIGSNGSCGSVCNAGSGYDYVTGLGSPRADRLIPALVDLP